MESKVFVCRICSEEIKHGILIFSEEGRRLYLNAKIRKYLYITLSMDDKLPKIICDYCAKKLQGIHRFASMAVKNQDKLNKLLTDTINYPAMEPKKIENKGLLHTYLTKGIIDKPTEDTEEMEVRVDPMLFLQYNSDDEDDDEEEENVCGDETVYESEQISTIVVQPQSHTQPQIKEKADKMTGKFNDKYTNEIQTENECKEKCIDKFAIKKYECNVCRKTFHSDVALQNHVWSHIPKNRRIILNNQNTFYLKPDIKPEEVEINDDQTDASNNNYDGEGSENGSAMRFACPICGKIISTKGNLKVHLETHRPKGKYGCDICGRIFKTQSNLYRHKDYHTGIQFTCNVCGRVYPTNSTLRAHSITHSDLRPHKCPLCDKTFKRNQDLKFHINQHTGARPYQCPYCPKAFASSGNCFSHRKRMHPMEVERDRERAAKIMR